MNRTIAALLVLVTLALPVSTALASGADVGEGYAKPTYPELIQTLILMGGSDITNTKIADEYGRLVYCDLYEKDFSNDVLWEKIRDEIVARALQKKEYYRVKYEVTSIFYLDRYDFKNEYFPISKKTPIANVGTVNMLAPDDYRSDCTGQGVYSNLFPMTVVLQLNEPLTIQGFKLPKERVDKLIVRMEEAGDMDRRVYGRMRMVVTDAKGIDFSQSNTAEVALNGKVISVDFFIDRELTKPIASILVNKE